jgi:hypothetical protein
MAITRCVHCKLPLTETEAAGVNCPACGAPHSRSVAPAGQAPPKVGRGRPDVPAVPGRWSSALALVPVMLLVLVVGGLLTLAVSELSWGDEDPGIRAEVVEGPGAPEASNATMVAEIDRVKQALAEAEAKRTRAEKAAQEAEMARKAAEQKAAAAEKAIAEQKPADSPAAKGAEKGKAALPAWLGLQLEAPGTVLAQQLDLPPKRGLAVVQVEPNSGAAKAGVRPGDVLLELNGVPVPADVGELVKALGKPKPAGGKVAALVVRKGHKEWLGTGTPVVAAPPPKVVAPAEAADGGPFPRDLFAMDAVRVVKVDRPNDDYIQVPLNNGAQVKLVGKARRLVLGAIDGGAALDASELITSEVFVGYVNNRARLRLKAPGGTVKIKELNGQSQVEVAAPGGRVTVAHVTGDAVVAIHAKEADFPGVISGANTQVVVTLSKAGRLHFADLAGAARLHWRKDQPGDPAPDIIPGQINAAAEFRGVD